MIRRCICLRCNHTWEGRVQKPQCCPACKSYDWKSPRKRGYSKVLTARSRKAQRLRAGKEDWSDLKTFIPPKKFEKEKE